MDDPIAAPVGAPTLDAAARKALKAQAHPLKPVVMIGHEGLTPAVLAEIERALTSHQLIKIRVLGDDREARAAMLAEVCEHTASAPVQHIGKLLVVWRPAPVDPQAGAGQASGRVRPNAPYHRKKAAGAGQKAPARRARPRAEAPAPQAVSPTGRGMARRGAAEGGGKPAGARGAAGGKAPKAARAVPLARGAAAGKPARPGRAPTLASPGERARGGRGAGTGGARPAGTARGASAGRSTGGRKR
jgi:RNA-binding protein